MSKRLVPLGLLVVLVSGLSGGCKKSATTTHLLPPPPVETVTGIHWLGKERLAAETNAAALMALWNLPESQRLEAQTLYRLAVGLLATNGVTPPFQPSTNAPPQLTGAPALLRPLLEDLLQRECFVNVRQATNQPGELTLAIKLDDPQARLWQTNLAALLETLTTGRAAALPGRTNGWQLQYPQHATRNTSQPPITRVWDLARVGNWTVVGSAVGSNDYLATTLSLFGEDPSGARLAPTNAWLFANLDLRCVASALRLNWDLPPELPRLTLSVNGDNKTVHTQGQLYLAQPLPSDLEPWNIPTNLIHNPLVSFTAFRGLRPWLAASRSWQALDLGTPPNQLFLWAQKGFGALSYCAAPMTNATNFVEHTTDWLLQGPNAYLRTNALGWVERATNGPGVLWAHVPFIAPHLEPVPLSSGDFVFGGLAPNLTTNLPAPAGLYETILGTTNLVAYDWELTGLRLDQWLNLGQFLRFALHLAQVPSTSLAWLHALVPKLGNCVTAVKLTGPARLSFVRSSTGIGLTSAELDLLADWLESPQFPRGLNTFLGEPARLRPPTGLLQRRTATNSLPPVPHPRPAQASPPARLPAPH
jgi:hypothetical protein